MQRSIVTRVIAPGKRISTHSDDIVSALQVFLEYADVESSARAKTGMHGRRFDGKETVAVFFPENKFADGDYDA